ncbi:MAG TPA: HepT-like ribonuclease domain-containing protein [Stellaceae bacterium]|nr:HepT-like ribonuclease domain-containing protein [Stellaceae bacterium]
MQNINRIERFSAGLNRESFVTNEQAFFAILHALLIISEAARKLGDEAEILAPDQPWPAIRSVGNVLRHAYDDVDPDVIWQIVHDDLPRLRRSIEAALVNIRSSGG